jgi:hypothetical protein
MSDFEKGFTVDWEWIVLLVLVALVAVVALITGAIGGSDHHTVDCADGLKIERAESWEPTIKEVRELCELR